MYNKFVRIRQGGIILDFSMFENMSFRPEMRQSVSHMTTQNNMTRSRFPEDTPVGMAYVPFQQWSEPYDEATAFSAGTIFLELNLPFEPEGGCNGQR